MNYKLECKYLEDEKVFVYCLTNQESKYFFEWSVSDVTEPRFLLTSNGIIFKCSVVEENFIFEIARSNGTDTNEKLIKSKYGNHLFFESNDPEINIVYDFYDFPDEKREIAGNVIGSIMNMTGSGIFESNDEYEILERKIIEILNKFDFKKTKKKTSVKQKEQLENSEK